MPLTRDALDQLLDTLQEQLAQRLACAGRDAGGPQSHAELAAWLERCAEVIRGFAGEADRAHVEARLGACLPRLATEDET